MLAARGVRRPEAPFSLRESNCVRTLLRLRLAGRWSCSCCSRSSLSLSAMLARLRGGYPSGIRIARYCSGIQQEYRTGPGTWTWRPGTCAVACRFVRRTRGYAWSTTAFAVKESIEPEVEREYLASKGIARGTSTGRGARTLSSSDSVTVGTLHWLRSD